MANEEEPKTKKTRRWVPIVLTTILTIIVTIGVGWITIRRGEKQAIQAEAERARGVKNNLISIIEEHIINQRPIDSASLVRLIGFKSREERLITRITVRDLIEQAEYNILNTRYLDFRKKEEYKSAFEQIYKELIPVEYAPFKDTLQADLLNKLAQSIREGSKEESMNLLGQYVEYVNDEVAKYKKTSNEKKDIGIFSIIKSPSFYMAMIAYLFVLMFLMRTIRKRRRR